MIRSIKLLVIVSLTTFGMIMLIAFGAWALTRPTGAGSLPMEVAESAPATQFTARSAALAETVQDRQMVYEKQLATLEAAIGEREATYQDQIQMLNKELAAYDEAIAGYQTEIQALTAQVAELERTLEIREGTYQEQLTQLNTQLADRRAQLQRQLEDARLALTDANAQLGR